MVGMISPRSWKPRLTRTLAEDWSAVRITVLKLASIPAIDRTMIDLKSQPARFDFDHSQR